MWHRDSRSHLRGVQLGVWHRYLAWAALLLLMASDPSSAQPEVRRVLLLNSYNHDPYLYHARIFRAELSRLSPTPINVYEVSIQLDAPSVEADREAPIVDYLRSALSGGRPDLVVAAGGPASVFARKHHERLFGPTPLLLAAVDQRFLNNAQRAANEAAVAVALDGPLIVDNILTLLPDTKRIFVVIGTSPLEKFWRAQLSREFERFNGRLTFVWLDASSFPQILERVSTLPANSAVLFPLFSIDAKGALQPQDRVLTQLRSVTNAPIFGMFDYQLGRGVVGGPVMSIAELGGRTAEVANRILQGELPGNITNLPFGHGQPTYDWRELQRWGIDESRLPTGSLVQFRQPGVWDQYRLYIVGAVVILVLQTLLIGGLVIQQARRRRTERALRESEQRLRVAAEQNQSLAGRLITAQEEERARIARDLHDDVSQQLAGVSIGFSGVKQRLGENRIPEDLQRELADLQQQTLTLARSVRHLSHDLHPTVLQHLGLAKALASYCGELEHAHGIAIRCRADGDVAAIAPLPALCLYRIVQEALRNVIAHAQASHAEVRLFYAEGTAEITISDNGRGFDIVGSEKGKGLGVVSITERAKIAGGKLTISSGLKQGTCVTATIPAHPRVKADAPPTSAGSAP